MVHERGWGGGGSGWMNEMKLVREGGWEEGLC